MGRCGLLFALLMSLGLLFTASCAVLKTKKNPPLVKPARPVSVYDPGLAIDEARGRTANGEYEKAVGLYKNALSLHPGNKKLLSGCREALLAAGVSADISFGKGDFSRAGGLYSLVDGNYKYLRPTAIKSGYLKKRIRACASALTQKGLLSYRKGEIKDAISSWEEVLKFDPGDSEVKKAADTAKLQLKNLSK